MNKNKPSPEEREDRAAVRGGVIGAGVGGVLGAAGHFFGMDDTIGLQTITSIAGADIGRRVGRKMHSHSALRKEQFNKKK